MKTSTSKFTLLSTNKKSIAMAAIITSIIFTGCSTPAEDVETAKESVENANQNLDQANDAYLKDIENYRKEASHKIELNDKSIAEFNARIANEKAETKADYQKKITALDNKNTDLKKSIADYQASGKENWEAFKTKFSQDMDDLGAALSAFFTPEKKQIKPIKNKNL